MLGKICYHLFRRFSVIYIILELVLSNYITQLTTHHHFSLCEICLAIRVP
jgi:hypothetical protein